MGVDCVQIDHLECGEGDRDRDVDTQEAKGRRGEGSTGDWGQIACLT